MLRCACAMQLSMRQTLRFPCRCTRDELYEARRALTPYDAAPVSVRGHWGKKCAAAGLPLADLVGEQVRLAQEQGVCADATPLWRAAATRCAVFVGVWPDGPATAGNPDNWVTWWVMDGSDDRGRLCAMDAEAWLSAETEHLQSTCNVPLVDGTVWGYEVGMTGDGKGMQVANHSPDGKCWSCDDHESLEPPEGVNENVR